MSNEKTELDKVKIAFAEGEEIQLRIKSEDGREWQDWGIGKPAWVDTHDYRIKPDYDEELFSKCKELIDHWVKMDDIEEFVTHVTIKDNNIVVNFQNDERLSMGSVWLKAIKSNDYQIKREVCKGFEWFKENQPNYLTNKEEKYFRSINAFDGQNIGLGTHWKTFKEWSDIYDIALPSGEVVPFITEEWVKA